MFASQKLKRRVLAAFGAIHFSWLHQHVAMKNWSLLVRGVSMQMRKFTGCWIFYSDNMWNNGKRGMKLMASWILGFMSNAFNLVCSLALGRCCKKGSVWNRKFAKLIFDSSLQPLANIVPCTWFTCLWDRCISQKRQRQFSHMPVLADAPMNCMKNNLMHSVLLSDKKKRQCATCSKACLLCMVKLKKNETWSCKWKLSHGQCKC